MSNLDIVKGVLSEETVERFAKKHGAKQVWKAWRDNMERQHRAYSADKVSWEKLPERDKELDYHISCEVLNDFIHWALSEIAIQDAEAESE